MKNSILKKFRIIFFAAILVLLCSINGQAKKRTTALLLKLLQITPTEQSLDYVANQKEFQLHTLITEQRHPKTWNLSFIIKNDTISGLDMLLSVDQDISEMLIKLRKPEGLKQLDQAVRAMEQAVLKGRKIYFYGCGATGRLAKQMESSFWRPFWRKIKSMSIWERLSSSLPATIEDNLIGEMTGGDRALISSLEGFEDLQLIGELQLKDRGIQKGDVVFCVTEGGETSSVIGTIKAALKSWGEEAKKDITKVRHHLYFIYNNPNKVLLPFARSKEVINNPYITKINLTTGPQSITGSTRMQATTSETFVLGILLENLCYRILKRFLAPDELKLAGFIADISLDKSLASFEGLQKSLYAIKSQIAKFTDMEADTYAKQRFSTYFAGDALITVFIDSTERSPTFRLYPLDTIKTKKRKSWIQVWTPAKGLRDAWIKFLGRNFIGLDPSFYQKPFATLIEDKFLRQSALLSLKRAGQDQELLYDFSFADFNIQNRAPVKNDLGVMVLLKDEIPELLNLSSPWHRWIRIFRKKQTQMVVILVTDLAVESTHPISQLLGPENDDLLLISLPLGRIIDPLYVKQHIALKMLLNAHSTAVMAKLGRLVGNTMTSVNPGNLKLIGRATYLILSHVNHILAQQDWIGKYGSRPPLNYATANAVLFDTINFIKKVGIKGFPSEVDLSIIRILETLKKKIPVSWNLVLSIFKSQGLEKYLLALNPALGE
jgi:N-acetylmuramic acid 6-phosphate (MurNAc-6-P) etherase